MTQRISLCLLLLLPLVALSAGPPGTQKKKDTPAEAKESAPRLVKLAAQAEKKPASSLAYPLLPDPLDQVEGNAAIYWLRAMMAARAARYKWTEEQWKWSGPAGTALDKLPLKEVKAALDKHADALRLADQAARRTRCDWGRQALTIQTLATELPFNEIAGMREIAHLLTLRFRVALAERKYHEALRTLQTGFALARQLSSNSLIIEDLVAIAISSIMLGCVEEWVQVPGSPNLYWALTTLPRPLIDIRPAIRVELNTIYRSFPELREPKQKKLTAERAQHLLNAVYDTCSRTKGLPIPAWMKKPDKALKHYPAAKRALIASGRTAREVEAMPKLQVVALYYLEQYDQGRDEILRWLSVPAWQGSAALEKMEAKLRARGREEGNIAVYLQSMLAPAITKVYAAQLRQGRQIAGLRGAEALRMHLADTGKAPAKWADITVPDPIDPFTGKGLDVWYKRSKEKAILNVPAPPGMPASLGRRYEMAAKLDKQ